MAVRKGIKKHSLAEYLGSKTAEQVAAEKQAFQEKVDKIAVVFEDIALEDIDKRLPAAKIRNRMKPFTIRALSRLAAMIDSDDDEIAFKASKEILKKTMPDLQQTEVTGGMELQVVNVVALPSLAEEKKRAKNAKIVK